MPRVFKNWIPDLVIFIFFGFWIFLYNYKYSWASFGTTAKVTGDKWFFRILLLRLGRCVWTVLSLGLLFPTKEARSPWVLNAPDLWGLPVCLGNRYYLALWEPWTVIPLILSDLFSQPQIVCPHPNTIQFSAEYPSDFLQISGVFCLYSFPLFTTLAALVSLNS